MFCIWGFANGKDWEADRKIHFEDCKAWNVWILMQWTIIILQSSSIFISLCCSKMLPSPPQTHAQHWEAWTERKNGWTNIWPIFDCDLYRALFAPIKYFHMHRNVWGTLFVPSHYGCCYQAFSRALFRNSVVKSSTA